MRAQDRLAGKVKRQTPACRHDLLRHSNTQPRRKIAFQWLNQGVMWTEKSDQSVKHWTGTLCAERYSEARTSIDSNAFCLSRLEIVDSVDFDSEIRDFAAKKM